MLGATGHDHVAEPPGFQKLHQLLGEKAGIGPHRSQLPARRQERQRLLEELADPTRGTRIAAAQPGVEDARGLGQHRQQRMMAVAPGAVWVVAPGGALLAAAALEDRRIQVQAEALGWRHKVRQKPAPERSPECLDRPLGEAGKEVANRVGAGKPGNAQHRV
jgi:hypothetical protein